MKLRNLISPLALAAALAISGAAVAQSTSAKIGDVEFAGDDYTSLQEKCAALAAQANTTTAPDQTENDESNDQTTDQTTGPDPAAEANVASIMSSLTVEQCKEAGL